MYQFYTSSDWLESICATEKWAYLVVSHVASKYLFFNITQPTCKSLKPEQTLLDVCRRSIPSLPDHNHQQAPKFRFCFRSVSVVPGVFLEVCLKYPIEPSTIKTDNGMHINVVLTVKIKNSCNKITFWRHHKTHSHFWHAVTSVSKCKGS